MPSRRPATRWAAPSGRAARRRRALDAAQRPETEAPAAQTAWQLGSASAHRQTLVASVSRARRRLVEAANAEHAARRALGDAVRAHEALLALRAEAAASHRAQAARTEGDRLDDLALVARSARAALPLS